ncbi:hypothetical protein BDQ17DRAFT_1425643 [Cyathus striatus]|nr:hypothetical protein BDQ17DRAFT_1425643 [Cyathus striatus]
MSDTLSLNCYVLGESLNENFIIDASPDTPIARLKVQIVNFCLMKDTVVPPKLKLWKVSIPVDSSMKARISALDLSEDDLLQPLQPLSRYFTNPPTTDHIHIIIKFPVPHLQETHRVTLDVLVVLEPGGCRAVRPTQAAYACARNLRKYMIKFYAEEQQRADIAKKILQDAGFIVETNKVVGFQYRMDSYVIERYNPAVILEVKNEISSPPTKTPLERIQPRNDKTYYPCFTITIVRQQITFEGDIYNDRSKTEVLSSISMDFHRSDEDVYTSLAWTIEALKRALCTLTERCNNPTRGYNSADITIFPYLKSYTSIDGSGSKVNFTYAKEIYSTGFLFLARSENTTSADIYVKFVHRYGKDVHIWMANQGFAPKLLG